MSDLNISVSGEVITPDNTKSQLAVRISCGTGAVEASAPQRIEAVSTLLWQLGFQWSRATWSWRYPEASRDFGVEVAYLLLAAGFPLRVPEESFRERILACDYVPETTRRIRLITEGSRAGWYQVSWCRVRDETYYQRSTRLSGARWSRERQAVIVPPDSASEVEDFAKLYDFTISDVAQRAIDVTRTAAVEKLRLKVKPRGARKPAPVGQVDESLVDELGDPANVGAP